MRALVTGANGFVGLHLVELLLEQGYTVRALVRSEKSAAVLPQHPNLEVAYADLQDATRLREAMVGVDQLFHVAAAYRDGSLQRDQFFAVNVTGTKNLYQAAQEARVRAVVHCSTIGVTSTIEHPPGDETLPYSPADAYQESKVAGEQLALELASSGALPVSVIRPAMIWGQRDTRFLKMFRGISKGFFPLIGGGQNMCHWIYVKDLVRSFWLAANTPQSVGQVFIIAGKTPVTLEQTVRAIAAHYGANLCAPKIPAFPIQWAGALCEMLCAPFGVEPPLHRRRADFFVKNRAFSIAKAQRVLGYEPQLNFTDEVGVIAQWYRDAGWV